MTGTKDEHLSWLTYKELGERRGIDPQSAVKLSRRQRWPRRPVGGVHGVVQVLVPHSWLETAPALPDLAAGPGRDHPAPS
jgi:hypothetical protein